MVCRKRALYPLCTSHRPRCHGMVDNDVKSFKKCTHVLVSSADEMREFKRIR